MSSCCSAGILDSFLACVLAFFFHVLVSFCRPCFSHVIVAKLSPRQCTSGHGISRHPHGSVIYARRFGAHSLVCVTGNGTNAGFGQPFSRQATQGGTQAKSVIHHISNFNMMSFKLSLRNVVIFSTRLTTWASNYTTRTTCTVPFSVLSFIGSDFIFVWSMSQIVTDSCKSN